MNAKFKIEGMSCDACRRHVEKAIADVPGVTAVNVDLKAATAQVEGNPDMGRIVAAVDEAGYTALQVQ
jgi:copper chaperone CopZ